MKRNVYVTNFSGIDTKDAQRFCEDGGEIIFITEGTVNIYQDDSLARNIAYKLRDMQSGDLLLIAGNNAIVAHCTAHIALRFGKVNLLVWNFKTKSYALQNVE